jgi:hypothetical protein
MALRIIREQKGTATIFAFGEGEDISTQIKNHDIANDWWHNELSVPEKVLRRDYYE